MPKPKAEPRQRPDPCCRTAQIYRIRVKQDISSDSGGIYIINKNRMWYKIQETLAYYEHWQVISNPNWTEWSRGQKHLLLEGSESNVPIIWSNDQTATCFSRETDCVLIELICFFRFHKKKTVYFSSSVRIFRARTYTFNCFCVCFPCSSDMELFLVFVGLHNRVTGGMQQLVRFPCVLVLGYTHSYVIFVFIHRDAFCLSIACHGLLNTGIQ